MEKLSNPEIDQLEGALGVPLPGLYRKLLVELGWGDIGHRCEIYHPSQVRGLYEPFFDDRARLFAPYFPFGCDNGKQEVWIIDGARELAASIWHETVPEDWPGEQWLSYEEWIKENFPGDEKGYA